MASPRHLPPIPTEISHMISLHLDKQSAWAASATCRALRPAGMMGLERLLTVLDWRVSKDTGSGVKRTISDIAALEATFVTCELARRSIRSVHIDSSTWRAINVKRLLQYLARRGRLKALEFAFPVTDCIVSQGGIPRKRSIASLERLLELVESGKITFSTVKRLRLVSESPFVSWTRRLLEAFKHVLYLDLHFSTSTTFQSPSSTPFSFVNLTYLGLHGPKAVVLYFQLLPLCPTVTRVAFGAISDISAQDFMTLESATSPLAFKSLNTIHFCSTGSSHSLSKHFFRQHPRISPSTIASIGFMFRWDVERGRCYVKTREGHKFDISDPRGISRGLQRSCFGQVADMIWLFHTCPGLKHLAIFIPSAVFEHVTTPYLSEIEKGPADIRLFHALIADLYVHQLFGYPDLLSAHLRCAPSGVCGPVHPITPTLWPDTCIIGYLLRSYVDDLTGQTLLHARVTGDSTLLSSYIIDARYRITRVRGCPILHAKPKGGCLVPTPWTNVMYLKGQALSYEETQEILRIGEIQPDWFTPGRGMKLSWAAWEYLHGVIP